MKKVLTMILAIAMVSSLFAVNVSAEGTQHFYQDFENVSPSDNKSGFSTASDANTTNKSRYIVDDPYKAGNKAVKFVNRVDNSVLVSYMNVPYTLNGECIFTFDYMQLDTRAVSPTNKYVYIEFSKGGASNNSPRFSFPVYDNLGAYRLTPADNVWYSFLVYINSDFSQMSLYRKERDSNEPYTLVRSQARSNLTGSTQGGIRTYCGQVDYMMDNIQLYQGSFGGDGYFTMNGEKITNLSQVTNGTLTAKVNYTSDDIVTEGTGVNVQKIVNSGTVYPLAVVYDASQKMIDCITPGGKAISAGRQEILMNINTSSFYNKLNGGYIGYYLWKDFVTVEPLIDAVELY